MPSVTFDTVRFGTITVDESELIDFPRGLIGFEQLRRFVILEGPEGTPLKWLQSQEEPTVAFVIADPRTFAPAYVAKVNADDLSPIELTGTDTTAVAVILSVPGDLSAATANLMGPLVFNVNKRLGAQVVVEDEQPVRHPVFSPLEHADVDTETQGG